MSRRKGKIMIRFLLLSTAIMLIALFLPWTQNIRTAGKVTTLTPGQRPQTIQSIIDGRIENWYVREGDFVEAGDTILFISEIKEEYFDPDLLARVQEQKEAKEQAAGSYSGKADALSRQRAALQESQVLKLQQAQNKLEQSRYKFSSDSIDLLAAELNFEIAQEQLNRMEALFDQGLKSQTQLEERRMKRQEAQAKLNAQQNKLSASQNEMNIARIEINNLQAEFADKTAKIESERFSALSSEFDARGSIAKLENQYANYDFRNQLYYITAPQSGYITQTIKSGIGETIKQGEALLSIMPETYDLAISTYIKPMDLPLITIGQKVRILFDGWPAVVFAGWPNASTGTFGGKVVAVDNFADANGMFRVLIAPDPEERPWPEAIRVGTGSRTMALLNNVPIWYELWRQINGFPPDFYAKSEYLEKDPKPRKPKYK